MPRRQKRDENASRLETYPRWLWEVFEAAKAGNGYLRTFPAHNYAVNAMHRYHEFRRDCIREGVPLAEIMTEMPCSWDKATKERTTLVWVFLGNLADYVQAPSGREPMQQATGAEGTAAPIRQLGDASESERLVAEMYGIGRNKDAAEFSARAEAPSDLDIPALDVSSSGEQPPPCPPHEGSDLNPFVCIKCGVALK